MMTAGETYNNLGSYLQHHNQLDEALVLLRYAVIIQR